MRIAEVDFILVPDWLADTTSPNHNADHWISRWQRNFATANWLDISGADPADALVRQSGAIARPVVVITHGRGVDVLLAAREALGATPVIGAFVVAPTPSNALTQSVLQDVQPPAFQSVVIASDDHPDYSPGEARQLADGIGGHFVAAGPTGRLDAESGQGPWPEGLMRLGWFLKQIRQH